MKTLEDEIRSLFRTAQRSVLVVAPFIRSEALKRLLDNVPAGIETTIVTRWRIEDLLAGASDLGVYELAEVKRAPLYLRSDLHAKLFAADEKCLVGSANVTNSALGRGKRSNLELLVPVPRKTDGIVGFEERLMARTIQATAAHRDRLRDLLETLRSSEIRTVSVEEEGTALMAADWVPQVRNPEELYSVYLGSPDVSRSAMAIMKEELLKIGVVAGLNAEEFRAWVGIRISQNAFVGQVIQHIEKHGEVTEADIGEFLTKIGVAPEAYPPRELLEVLERWLTCFLAMRYETARDSVKLIKARIV